MENYKVNQCAVTFPLVVVISVLFKVRMHIHN